MSSNNNNRRWTAAAAALTLCTMANIANANVLNNGDFEAGSLSGWMVTGATGFTGTDALSAHSGNFGAYFGEDTPGSSIAQSFASVAGTPYMVDFWIALDDSAQPSNFTWSWNGTPQALSLTNAAGFAYAHVSVGLTASTAITTLQFNFTNPNSFWLLDDVNVSPVPEPASWVLGCAGLLLMAARRRASAR